MNGWDFQWSPSDSSFGNNLGYYDCRGEVTYDDEHDEIPEPELWEAGMKLEAELFSEGFIAEAGYSEKGWVEITVYRK